MLARRRVRTCLYWRVTHAQRLVPVLFAAAALFAVTPWCGPALALVIGALLALSLGNPFSKETKRWTKYLLQASIVLLGFGMNFVTVLKAGRDGLGLTALTISATLVLGMGIAKLLAVRQNPAALISVGTAICGGSAIAAVAPVIEADDNETSISLSVVFLLNAVGLLIFPAIGHALHMSEPRFGLWAALAIHDTSSVVGATAKYGAQALMVGTTVKLARALWIVPVTLLAAALSRTEWWRRRHHGHVASATRAKIAVPWFILWYVVAAAIATYLSRAAMLWSGLNWMGKRGLTLALFLIGAGMTRSAIKTVGARPMVLAVILWIIAGSVAIAIVLR